MLHLNPKQNFKMPTSHRPLSFSFSKNLDLPMFLIFRAVGEIRRVQIPRDICTWFGRYLYSKNVSWIIIVLYHISLYTSTIHIPTVFK